MEHNFYSSRSERLSVASSGTKKAYENRSSKSFFKKNPQLKILAVDLILVLLFGVIIIPFFLNLTKDIRIDDYKISSKAIEFENNILLSIKVSKLYKKTVTRKTDENLKVDIINNNNIINSSNISFPKVLGEDKFISFKLENSNNVDLVIRFTSGNFLKEYKAHIER